MGASYGYANSHGAEVLMHRALLAIEPNDPLVLTYQVARFLRTRLVTLARDFHGIYLRLAPNDSPLNAC